MWRQVCAERFNSNSVGVAIRLPLPHRRAAWPLYLLGPPDGNAHPFGLHSRGARPRSEAVCEDDGTHPRDLEKISIINLELIARGELH